MTLNRSPRVAVLFFSLLLALLLIGSTTLEIQAAAKKHGKGRSASSKRSARGGKHSRGGRRDRRARGSRRGGRLSKRGTPAGKPRQGREQTPQHPQPPKRTGRKLSKRELAAEIRKFQSTHRRALEEARRRAEAARAAAIARQRAIEEGMRNEAEANIAKDSTVGEDLDVRKAAVEALGHHAGTVVVMDPKSGRIYTVVNQDWGLRRGFKPCSTIKLVTGVAGISEKVISPMETASDGGNYRIDLTDALAYSNNSYFQNVG